MIKKVIAAVFAICVVVVTFQNCSEKGFLILNDGKNNGMPYDGKPYMSTGACSDGTTVATKVILMANMEAVMVRQNCVDLAQPVFYQANQYTIDQSDGNRMLISGVEFMSNQ